MAWFHNRTAANATAPRAERKTADPAHAEALLQRAQELRAAGDLIAAQTLAEEALHQSLRAHGERHAALVPFLLVYAGLLNQCQGWAAGKPFYDRAQRLRGLASAPR
ncbi:MAG: hypothetical protein KBF21_00355 [Thermoanaerobaculia bacterium]|nr:hypothetical protein [Thermoanaerobaculia bacterium]MBP9822647.1 hypothetical protein [Thermoanaerobaculia bacterium]